MNKYSNIEWKLKKKIDFLGLDIDKNDLRIVTKNKKKKEREAALKIKKATGARKKENTKDSETKVMLCYWTIQFDYWLVNNNDKREYFLYLYLYHSMLSQVLNKI